MNSIDKATLIYVGIMLLGAVLYFVMAIFIVPYIKSRKTSPDKPRFGLVPLQKDVEPKEKAPELEEKSPVLPKPEKEKEISWDDLIGLVYETQNRWSPFGNYKRIFFEFDTNGHCKVFEQAGRGSQAVAVVDVLGGSSKEAVARAIKVCNHYYLAQELVKEKN